MKSTLASRIPLILILLLTLVFAKLQANKRLGSKAEMCVNICSDGRGYYAWLPALFIYHDVNFHFFDTVETRQQPCGGPVGGCMQDYRNYINGRPCNKYYPGTAMLMLPFFAIAHIIAATSGTYDPSGYSEPYFALIGFSGIFYYFLGMLVMLLIMRRLGLNTLQQSLTILLLSLGTNAMYYAVDKPCYSHIYSFALMAAFLYYALRLRERISGRRLAYISFITGLIFITRPVNISIVLVLPFLFAGNIKTIMVSIKPAHLLCLLPGLIMPMLLMIIYKAGTGSFIVYSYTHERFDFLHPHFWQFLFHQDNGVFPYMPLLFMPFLFLYTWYKQTDKNIIRGAIITLLITIYIHSSWWCWSYGFAFGARTMLDFVPLFGIIIALSIKGTNLKKHFYLLPIYFLCAALTMILYHEKNHGFMSGEPVTDYWPAIRAAFGMK